MRSKTPELHPLTEFDYGPLFGGSERHDHARVQSTVVDADERLRWARRALLGSNLETFGAEDVRRAVVERRPHYLETGHWIGGVFRSTLFVLESHERSTHPAAKARWILRYRLSEEGQRARASLIAELRL